MSDANKAMVRRFYEAVNTGNLDQLDDLIVTDYIHHDEALPPEMQRGRDAYKGLCAMFISAFPDLHGTIDDLVAEGDKVACRLTWRGTHRGNLMGIPATGKQATFSEMSIQRIANGKIMEGWVTFDALGMMQQLGAIPAPTQAG